MKVFVLWSIALTLLTLSFPKCANAFKKQDDSSRRDVAVIKAIETVGGRVANISAADSSREISFYLASQPIGDQQIKDIGAVRETIWLNLAGTEISNDGLKALAGLPLKKLHLERTKIGDAGLVHLKSFQDLEYLNLYGTQVTDAGLEHLKPLKKLKKLYVWQTQVTQSGIKRLNESLPDLEIVSGGKLVIIEDPKKEDPKKEDPKKEDPKKEEADKEAALPKK